MRSTCLSESSANGPPPGIPALFTRTSHRPYSLWTRSAIDSIWERSLTSHGTARARPPRPSIHPTSSRSRSSLRAEATTVEPARAKATAVARPIPADAPVTTTTASPSSIGLQPGQGGGGLPAIDHQHGSGDEGGRRRAQEQGCPGHVLRAAPPAQGDGVQDAPVELRDGGPGGRVQLRLHPPGGQRVHPDHHPG